MRATRDRSLASALAKKARRNNSEKRRSKHDILLRQPAGSDWDCTCIVEGGASIVAVYTPADVQGVKATATKQLIAKRKQTRFLQAGHVGTLKNSISL